MQRLVAFIRARLENAWGVHADLRRDWQHHGDHKETETAAEDGAEGALGGVVGDDNGDVPAVGKQIEQVCDEEPPSISSATPPRPLLHVDTRPSDVEPKPGATVVPTFDCLHDAMNHCATLAVSKIPAVQSTHPCLHTCHIKNEPACVDTVPPMCFSGPVKASTLRLPGEAATHTFTARDRVRPGTRHVRATYECTSKVGRDLESTQWVQLLQTSMIESLVSTMFSTCDMQWARVCTGWFPVSLDTVKTSGDALFSEAVPWLNYRHCTDGTLMHVDTQLVHCPSPVPMRGSEFIVVVALLVPKEHERGVERVARKWQQELQRKTWSPFLTHPRLQQEPLSTVSARFIVSAASKTQSTLMKSDRDEPVNSPGNVVVEYIQDRGSKAHLPLETHCLFTSVSAATLCVVNKPNSDSRSSWNFSRMDSSTPLFTVSFPPTR
jgi:hypothetical protein